MKIKLSLVSLLVAGLIAGIGLMNPRISIGGEAGGTLKGSVTFKGVAPVQAKINTSADPICKQMHPQGVKIEEYVIGKNGGLKNVFVYVKQGLEGKTFPVEPKAATISQQGCQYIPHVVGVQVN